MLLIRVAVEKRIYYIYSPKKSCFMYDKKKPITIKDIIWSVIIVSSYVPRATCLTQAITAQILLSRHNQPSKLKIGVMKDEEFEAHAWLEIDDKIVLGESEKEYMQILESEFTSPLHPVTFITKPLLW